MAKKSRKSRRVLYDAKRSLPIFSFLPPSGQLPLFDYSQIRSTPSRLIPSPRKVIRKSPAFQKMQGFVQPDLFVCARRQIRKEVLHAFGKSGKGGQKSPRYNSTSKIRCP